ncbi:MAG: HAD-IA family hydrolase [Methanobacteriota archaeon]|nr:MAG: HAD-IA family hydrolase [Euryarchaeota archaeon]
MTEELDVVFFDLGGTLIDVSVPREQLWANVLSRHGKNVDLSRLAASIKAADRDMDDHLASIQGMDEEPFWLEFNSRVLEGVGVDVASEEVASDLSRSFCRLVADEEKWRDYPDARPLLEDLSHRDIKVGLISNATNLARRVLRRLDLERYFDPIVISSEIGHRKPSREIFYTALDRAGAAPSRSIYIGDKPAVDVVGAKNAGMNAILVDREDTFPGAQCFRVRDLEAIRTFVRV